MGVQTSSAHFSPTATQTDKQRAGTELWDGIPARRFQNSSLGQVSGQVCNCGTRQIPSYHLTLADPRSSSALCPTETSGAFQKACKSNYSKNKTKVINTAWMANLPLFLFRAGISACRKFSLPLWNVRLGLYSTCKINCIYIGIYIPLFSTTLPCLSCLVK